MNGKSYYINKALKVFGIVVLSAALTAAQAGCSGNKSTGPVPSASPQGTVSFSLSTAAPSGSAPASALPSATDGVKDASSSYTGFMDAGVAACQGMIIKLEGSEEPDQQDAFRVTSTMLQSMMAIVAVKATEGKDIISQFESLEYKDMSVTQNGDVYVIDYTNPEGTTVRQTCEYDAASDSLKTALYNTDGNEALAFEYVRTPKGFAAQCYTKADGGKYKVCEGFFNGSDFISFGYVSAADSVPESIYKNTSISTEYVQNGEIYCILNGTALSVYDNGMLKTY